MNHKVLFTTLAATLLLCTGLAMRDDAEVVASRPEQPARKDRAAADTDIATRQPRAAAPDPLAASRRSVWPDVAATAVAAWAGAETAASAPQVAAAQRLPAAVVSAARPPVPPSASPPPRAPASGFELIGTVIEGASRGALIQTAQRSLWVRAGDTVEGAWRVEQVRADSVDLLWLPQQLPAALRYRAP